MLQQDKLKRRMAASRKGARSRKRFLAAQADLADTEIARKRLGEIKDHPERLVTTEQSKEESRGH